MKRTEVIKNKREKPIRTKNTKTTREFIEAVKGVRKSTVGKISGTSF